MNKSTENKYLNHETKKQVLFKFLLVLIVFLIYFWFVSWKYGLGQGLSVTILTWSFFVFCTPIADAGFLLDFPLRLITKIRMIYSEMIVWLISFITVTYFSITHADIFQHSIILKIYYQIITHPYPFWLIIILSMIGTFLSVYFGDELMDVVLHKERKKFIKHSNKHHFVIFLFLIVSIIFSYYYLLKEFNLNLF